MQTEPSTAATTPSGSTIDGGKKEIIGFQNLLGVAAKFAVFAIFILYSIGFIIWRTYLGSYGISSVTFLQAEYLAAAFCYLFLLATFSVPPILLFAALMRTIIKEGARNVAKWDSKWVVIACFWVFLCWKTIGIFFPYDVKFTLTSIRVWEVFLGITAVHVCVMLFSGIKSGAFAELFHGARWQRTASQQRWKQSVIHRYLARLEYIGIYLLITLFVFLLENTDINRGFLFSTMILYTTATSTVTQNFATAWRTADGWMRLLYCVFVALALIANIQQFATTEFPKIPKSVGGGRPEVAYVKFSNQHPDLAVSLNLPPAVNCGLSNAFFGPVGVLLRSGKEVFLLNYADVKSPENFTNDVVLSIQTNSVPFYETNSSTGILWVHQTNVVVRYRTNLTYNVYKDISKNPTRFTARQVNADLIDAIAFSR